MKENGIGSKECVVINCSDCQAAHRRFVTTKPLGLNGLKDNMAWHVMSWHGMACHDMPWHGMVCHGI